MRIRVTDKQLKQLRAMPPIPESSGLTWDEASAIAKNATPLGFYVWFVPASRHGVVVRLVYRGSWRYDATDLRAAFRWLDSFENAGEPMNQDLQFVERGASQKEEDRVPEAEEDSLWGDDDEYQTT